MTSAADYPLDRIRPLIEANERNPDSLARRKRDEQQRIAEDHEHLLSMANKALSGTYGFKAKAVARECTDNGARMDIGTLKRLRRELRKVPGRESG